MFSAARSQYSTVKKYSLSWQGRKRPQKCTWMVEFRRSRDWGRSRTLSRRRLVVVIRQCQHRVYPRGLFCCKVTPHFSAQNCSLAVAPFPTIEEWRGATQTLRDCWNKNGLTAVVFSLWARLSVRPGMLWCRSTPFTALSLQYIQISRYELGLESISLICKERLH